MYAFAEFLLSWKMSMGWGWLFASFTPTQPLCKFQVDIIMGMDSGDLSDFVENVEWKCHGMPATKNVIMYGCCSDPYPDITYTVLLQRRSSFYIFNLLLPCFLISFLAPLGFYLPADSGEKVSLGVTVLLALTVFQLMVAESMPPSESVPLIGKNVFLFFLRHCQDFSSTLK